MATVETAAIGVRRWTRQEYERLAELGLLRPDERVEPIVGRGCQDAGSA